MIIARLGGLAASALLALAWSTGAGSPRATWMSDNGNGTYTNPLFYDEFSDPDVIRVGDDYYLTGTTMHAMPGLPVLHSRDLVNWKLLGYAFDRLDLGPDFRLKGGEIYGQGIWAPCLRYHDGTFYLFANVNGHPTQLFRATNPTGPWTRSEMKHSFHDLSVLFDRGGKAYVVWGYNEIEIAQLTSDLTDIVPGSQHVLIPKGRGMGEGSHFYHINGRYYLFSAHYDPIGYEVVARSDAIDGPYEIATTSAAESFGLGAGWRLKGMGRGPDLQLVPPKPNEIGSMALHQGGVVQAPTGEWWALSMMDHNAVGRLTCLSPVTWRDDWPLFGLPGNPTRTPLTWFKPTTGRAAAPSAPYERSDLFAGPGLKPVWQWNHVPDDARWSLSERPGFLRLHALAAASLWDARNSLTQRCVGPESTATVMLDVSGLGSSDTAGLALLNRPYAWIGIRREGTNTSIAWYDQILGHTRSAPFHGSRVWLRVRCDFDGERGSFSYSEDGAAFHAMGEDLTLVFQLKTFQGVRFALFNFSSPGVAGGYADFHGFTVDEPRANPGAAAIPLGKTVVLAPLGGDRPVSVWNGHLRVAGVASPLRVVDCGRGCVALKASSDLGSVVVAGVGAAGDVRVVPEDEAKPSVFLWTPMEDGGVMLLSLQTQRYLRVDPDAGGLLSADALGASASNGNGARFRWSVAK